MSNTVQTLQAIKDAISAGRISTYEAAAPPVHPADPRAIALYVWNAQISAYLLMPLHICEVVVRNAASDAIEAIHGPDWPWNAGFQISLPPRINGTRYSPRRDLQNVGAVEPTTGKVIPELKFAFWEHMFTARHDAKIWKSQILRVFPNCESGMTWHRLRNRINADLNVIRKLRNRIAHHEPIFSRNLVVEFQMLCELVDLRSPVVSSWMTGNQIASNLLAKPPFFCGGKRWVPDESEIAELAYSIWEKEGRQSGSESRNWFCALSLLTGR